MENLDKKMKNLDKHIRELIIKNTIRNIQLAMLKKQQKGLIINEIEINEILFNIEAGLKEVSEEAEIDEGGEELEDEEKIADAIDTEDLGAKADYAYAQEMNK